MELGAGFIVPADVQVVVGGYRGTQFRRLYKSCMRYVIWSISVELDMSTAVKDEITNLQTQTGKCLDWAREFGGSCTEHESANDSASTVPSLLMSRPVCTKVKREGAPSFVPCSCIVTGGHFPISCTLFCDSDNSSSFSP